MRRGSVASARDLFALFASRAQLRDGATEMPAPFQLAAFSGPSPFNVSPSAWSIAGAHPGSCRVHSDDRCLLQLGAVLLQCCQTVISLLPSRNGYEPYDPAVGLAEDDGSLAEVLVQRDKNPLLLMRESQDLLVPWIAGPLASPTDVVSGFPQGG